VAPAPAVFSPRARRAVRRPVPRHDPCLRAIFQDGVLKTERPSVEVWLDRAEAHRLAVRPEPAERLRRDAALQDQIERLIRARALGVIEGRLPLPAVGELADQSIVRLAERVEVCAPVRLTFHG